MHELGMPIRNVEYYRDILKICNDGEILEKNYLKNSINENLS